MIGASSEYCLNTILYFTNKAKSLFGMFVKAKIAHLA
jgi:hypothetical protein